MAWLRVAVAWHRSQHKCLEPPKTGKTGSPVGRKPATAQRATSASSGYDQRCNRNPQSRSSRAWPGVHAVYGVNFGRNAGRVQKL